MLASVVLIVGFVVTMSRKDHVKALFPNPRGSLKQGNIVIYNCYDVIYDLSRH